MVVAYVLLDGKNHLLPECTVITPQIEPYKNEGVFLGLDSRGINKFALTKMARQCPSAASSSRLVSRAACSAGCGRYDTFILDPEKEAAFLAPLPVEFMWLLPKDIIAQIKLLGLQTIGQVREISRAELCFQFGEHGPRIYNYSRAVDKSLVLPLYPPRQINFTRSFEGLAGTRELETVLKQAAEFIAGQLSYQSRAAGWIELEVIMEEGNVWDNKRVFTVPACAVEYALIGMKKKMHVTSPVVHINVTAGGLRPDEQRQQRLWEYGRPWDNCLVKEKVSRLASGLRDKYPDHQVCWASEIEVSRREKMLSLWDPMRFR